MNWFIAEELAQMRADELSACLNDDEIVRLEMIQELAERRPLKARLGSTLVRIGARLDPAAIHAEADGALAEGRLAAYLR